MSKTEPKKIGLPSRAFAPEGIGGVSSAFLAETERYRPPKTFSNGAGGRTLKIGPANDRFEREADRVASLVTREASSESHRAIDPAGFGVSNPSVQMKRTEKQLQDDMIRAISPDTPPEPIVRLQRDSGSIASGASNLSAPGEGTSADPLHSFSHEVRRGKNGAPLSKNLRGDLESRFGRNFQRVRIHTDAAAHRLNEQVGARAFAYKNDIYFGRNQFRPGTTEGRHLLAHELTHAVQQGAAPRLAAGAGVGISAISAGPGHTAEGVVQCGGKHKMESTEDYVDRTEDELRKRPRIKKLMKSSKKTHKDQIKAFDTNLKKLRKHGKEYSEFLAELVGVSRTEERGITAFKSKPAQKRARHTRSMTRAKEQKFLKDVHSPFQSGLPQALNKLVAEFEPSSPKPIFTEVQNLGTGDLGRGKGMKAWLTPAHFIGSTPDDDAEIWYGLGDLRWTAPTYIQGHLLNENLGGEGKRWNLTPITNEANSRHKTEVEKYVKEWVNDDKKDVYYEVIPNYSGTHDERQEEKDIDDYFKKTSVKAGVEKRLKQRKTELSIEREKLAMGLDCTAYEIEWDSKAKGWKKKSGGEDLPKTTIPNKTGGDLETSKKVDLGFSITF